MTFSGLTGEAVILVEVGLWVDCRGKQVMADNLLLDEYPLLVLPQLATLIGLNEAIILQQVHYWVQQNKQAGRNIHEGYHWTFNSYPQWQEQMPFMSLRTIRRTFINLERTGYLITASFNKARFDRSKWYRVDYLRLEGAHRCGQSGHPLGQSGRMDEAELDSPIPETTSETTTKNILKKRYGERVTLTEKEHERLLARFGEAETADRIEGLSLYKQSRNKRYASDYATILNWARRDNHSGEKDRSSGKAKRMLDGRRDTGDHVKFDDQGKFDHVVQR